MTSQQLENAADTARLRQLADKLDDSDRIADADARHDTQRELLVRMRAEVDRLQAGVWRDIVRHRRRDSDRDVFAVLRGELDRLAAGVWREIVRHHVEP
jgi:hypothetical protein